MSHRIPCEVIQDLLPLYADGLTSEATDREIREHLAQCDACREQYERMKREVEDKIPVEKVETDEIDFLKKVKRRGRRNVFIGAVLVLLAVLGGLFAKLYVIGSPTDAYVVTYTNVNDGHVQAGGSFYGSAEVYSRYRLKKGDDGTQELVIYACLASPWNRNGVFNLDLKLPPEGQRLDINGVTVESDGTVIGKKANDLYRAKNPYIGDASADGRLAVSLGIGRELGSFKNELQTTAEPYGWTLHFEESIANSAVFDEKMQGFACALIALTENLGEVSWTYTVELADGPVLRSRTVTQEECSRYLGEPVKSFAESPKRVQELLDLLGIQ